MTDPVETRRFSIDGKRVDYELDLRTPNKMLADIRKRNLQRMGYHVQLIADEDQTIIVYSLYKHKQYADRKYYPIAGRLGT